MAEIENLLDGVIEKDIQKLDSISDPEKRTAAIRDLAQLHKLRIEEIKAQVEADEKRERREMDSKKNEAELNFKAEQMKAQNEQAAQEHALKLREAAGKEADRAREERALAQQAQENKIDRCVKVAVAGVELVLPLAFYGIWMGKGFKFEETGSYTSTTFKNLLNRFRPTK